MTVSRRRLLQSSAAATALAALPACARKGTSVQGAGGVLDGAVDFILNAYPETASTAGLDAGKYAAVKSRLTDRSPAGQAAIKAQTRDLLARLAKVDTASLPADEALNVDVVKTVFETASEGFDFPYGDMALLNNNWSYRNSPYAVAQNTGAFVEIPSFLDSSHSIANAEDADAYLARMEAYAGQLDGETARVAADGEHGVILPDFLMAKTLGQLRGARAAPAESWGVVSSLAARAGDFGGDYAAKAAAIAE